MLWLISLLLVMSIVGIVICKRHDNNKLVVLFIILQIVAVIAFIIMLPGLLFAFSNWQF